MRDLTDILGALKDNPRADIKYMLGRIDNFFLEANGQKVRLIPAEESLHGIGVIDIHINQTFRNFDAVVSQLDIEPAEGFTIDDIMPNQNDYTALTFDKHSDSGVEVLKVTIA